jgi:hypothetical protein
MNSFLIGLVIGFLASVHHRMVSLQPVLRQLKRRLCIPLVITKMTTIENNKGLTLSVFYLSALIGQ